MEDKIFGNILGFFFGLVFGGFLLPIGLIGIRTSTDMSGMFWAIVCTCAGTYHSGFGLNPK